MVSSLGHNSKALLKSEAATCKHKHQISSCERLAKHSTALKRLHPFYRIYSIGSDNHHKKQSSLVQVVFIVYYLKLPMLLSQMQLDPIEADSATLIDMCWTEPFAADFISVTEKMPTQILKLPSGLMDCFIQKKGEVSNQTSDPIEIASENCLVFK